jgi:hypothetical protein
MEMDRGCLVLRPEEEEEEEEEDEGRGRRDGVLSAWRSIWLRHAVVGATMPESAMQKTGWGLFPPPGRFPVELRVQVSE